MKRIVLISLCSLAIISFSAWRNRQVDSPSQQERALLREQERQAQARIPSPDEPLSSWFAAGLAGEPDFDEDKRDGEGEYGIGGIKGDPGFYLDGQYFPHSALEGKGGFKREKGEPWELIPAEPEQPADPI